MELKMSNGKWLVAALGLLTLTACCAQESYYRGVSHGYTPPGDRSRNSAHRDADRDGIPNRHDRDANGGTRKPPLTTM